MVKMHKIFAQKIVESANRSEIPAGTYVEGAAKPPLPGGFGRGFENAFAVLGLPSVCLAGLGEVLGDALAAFLSLDVFNFVEVHFCIPLSFICLYYNMGKGFCQPLFLHF